MISLPHLFSQRDARWKSKILGFGEGTIGAYGCTLTCSAMVMAYYGRTYTPDMLNSALQADPKGAFVGATKNILVWDALVRLMPSLEYRGTVNTYDDVEVKKYLALGQPVILRVDAAPIGAPRSDHFVIALGDGSIADPWDGKVKTFSTYTPTGYRLLIGIPGGQTMPISDEITIKKTTFEDLVSKATKFDAIKAVGVESEADVVAMRQREQEAKNAASTASEQAENTRKSFDLYRQRVAQKLNGPQDIDRVISAIDEMIRQYDLASAHEDDLTKDLAVTQAQIIDLQSEVTRLKLTLKSNRSLSTASKTELLTEFFHRVMGIVGK